MQAHGRIPTANDRWDAQLASHDSGMLERRADFGHDGCGAREQWRPVNVRQRCYQGFAWLELIALFNVLDHSHLTLNHSSRACKAGDHSALNGLGPRGCIEPVAAGQQPK